MDLFMFISYFCYGFPAVLSLGCRMVVDVVAWLSHGCRLVVAWLSLGCRVVVAWLSRGCRLVVAWLSLGCRLVVAWLSRGCCVVVAAIIFRKLRVTLF
jgi:hypothetical protein